MNLIQQYKTDFRKNLHLAFPIILGQVGQIMVNFIDNAMVGRITDSGASLAAVSLANAIFISVMVVGMGISFALPPLVAEANSNGNHQRISQYFKHSGVINLVFAFLAILLIEGIILTMPFWSQDAKVIELAIPYLRISAYSLIPFMLFQTFRCYSDGYSETIPPMVAMLLGNVVNVIANYALIYGNYGAPKLGVKGAALGTLIARWVTFSLLVLILMNWKNIWKDIRSANYKHYQSNLFKKLLKLGVPTSLQGFFEVSAFAGAAYLAGMINKETQAAHQIAISLASISFMICTGLAMAATIRVGNQLGEKNTPALRNAGFSAILQVLTFMTATSILYISLREFLPTLYLNMSDKSSEVIAQSASGLLILAAIFQIPDGIQVTAIGALRGMQDVFIPSIITFVAYWVFALPIAYFLAFHTSLGSKGIWVGLTVGLTISAAFMTYRFHRKSKG